MKRYKQWQLNFNRVETSRVRFKQHSYRSKMIPNQNQNIRQNPRNFNVSQLSNNNNIVNTVQIRNPQRSPLAVNTNRFNVYSLSQFNSPRISRDQMINPNSILYSPARKLYRRNE